MLWGVECAHTQKKHEGGYRYGHKVTISNVKPLQVIRSDKKNDLFPGEF